MSCPFPKKRRWLSERAAKNYIHSWQGTPQGDIHPYRCGAHWHIGHSDVLDRRKARRA